MAGQGGGGGVRGGGGGGGSHTGTAGFIELFEGGVGFREVTKPPKTWTQKP